MISSTYIYLHDPNVIVYGHVWQEKLNDYVVGDLARSLHYTGVFLDNSIVLDGTDSGLIVSPALDKRTYSQEGRYRWTKPLSS